PQLLRHPAPRARGQGPGDRVLRAGGGRSVRVPAHEHVQPGSEPGVRVRARREGPGTGGRDQGARHEPEAGEEAPGGVRPHRRLLRAGHALTTTLLLALLLAAASSPLPASVPAVVAPSFEVGGNVALNDDGDLEVRVDLANHGGAAG